MDNGKEVWICNYRDISNPVTSTPPQPPDTNETADLSTVISGNTNLKVGFSRTYTATLSDKDGNSLEWDDTLHGWNVISDFDVKQDVTENKIKLFVDDENFIGNSFLLQVIKLDDNAVIGEIEITVMDVV